MFGSPHVLMEEVAKGHNGIMNVLVPGGEATGESSWRTVQHLRPGFEPFPEFCAFCAGLQAMTPRLFGDLPSCIAAFKARRDYELNGH